jgi:hypothetical protein
MSEAFVHRLQTKVTGEVVFGIEANAIVAYFQ